MKTILNKTRKPLKIRLPADKTLFLGGLRQAKVSDAALEHPPLKKLLEAGEVEVVGGAGNTHLADTSGSLGQSSGAQAQSGGRGKLRGGDR